MASGSSTSRASLPFGSASAYNNTFLAPPTKIDITNTTCYQLSLFKDLMSQFRKLDDAVIVRLNRANAQLRDEARKRGVLPIGEEQESCLNFWNQMVGGWESRRAVIAFCLDEVNKSLESKKASLKGQEKELSTRRETDSLFELEVLRNQISNEHYVEAIIRKRTLEAFKSRCKFFSPPRDERSQIWWQAADMEKKVA